MIIGGSFSLVEFVYNNIYHFSIGIAPFKVLYGIPRRSPSWWLVIGDRVILGHDMIYETIEAF